MQLGDIKPVSKSLMFNLLGEMPRVTGQSSVTEGHVFWHDYHKTPRAGRKIGHVTITAKTDTGLKARAAQLAAELGVAAEINLEAVIASLSKAVE